MADVVNRAEEAVQVARKLEGRLNESFGKGVTIKMIKEPVAAQSSVALTGSLFASNVSDANVAGSGRDEHFFVEFQITKNAQ